MTVQLSMEELIRLEDISAKIFDRSDLLGILEKAIALSSVYPEIKIQGYRGFIHADDLKSYERGVREHRHYLYLYGDISEPDDCSIASMYRGVGAFVFTSVTFPHGTLDRDYYFSELPHELDSKYVYATIWHISVNCKGDPETGVKKALRFKSIRETGLSGCWSTMSSFAESFAGGPAELVRQEYSHMVTLDSARSKLPSDDDILKILGLGYNINLLGQIHRTEERVSTVARSLDNSALYHLVLETTSPLESMILYGDENLPRKMKVSTSRIGLHRASSKVDKWVETLAVAFGACANGKGVVEKKPEPTPKEEILPSADKADAMRVAQLANISPELQAFYEELQRENGVPKDHAVKLCARLNETHHVADHDLKIAIENFIKPNLLTRIALWWRGA